MMAERVNNEVYRRRGHMWWDDDEGEFSAIRFFINPVRFKFFVQAIERAQSSGQRFRTVLDVGCGGGFLSEEFARGGFEVSGIDPAAETIETARTHAAATGLAIHYQVGSGESIPFPDASFDLAACCDVLEHVDDLERVIGEIARVLRPGGLFLYDTINRTVMSKIAVIKVMQEWKATAFAEPNSHIWGKFIRPEELFGMLHRHGLENRETRGISVSRNPFAVWLEFHRRVKGTISFKELGSRLGFRESDDLTVSYMGWAEKETLSSPSSETSVS